MGLRSCLRGSLASRRLGRGCTPVPRAVTASDPVSWSAQDSGGAPSSAAPLRRLASSSPLSCPRPSTWTELIGSQRGVEGISLPFHGRRPLGPHPGFPPGLSWMALGRGVNNATVLPIIARRVGGPGGQCHLGFAASLPRSLGSSQTKARPLVLKVMVSDLVKAPRRTLVEDGAAEPVSGRRTRHSVLTQFQKCFMI